MIIFLIAIIVFNVSFTNVSASKVNAQSNDGNVEILVNNPQKIKLKMQNQGVIGFLEFDKDTREITYKTNEKSKKGNNDKAYVIEIEEATSEGVIAEFTDTDEGTTYEYNSVEASASWAFLIPVGIAIGGALIEQLIALGLAIVIGGVAYIAYEEFTDRRKDYSHYAVHLDGKLFFSNGLTQAKAISRAKSGYDTWSTTKANAQTIAKGASPLGKAIGPEIDKGRNGLPKPGYFNHYHIALKLEQGEYTRLIGSDKYNKTGVHVFYGVPAS